MKLREQEIGNGHSQLEAYTGAHNVHPLWLDKRVHNRDPNDTQRERIRERFGRIPEQVKLLFTR